MKSTLVTPDTAPFDLLVGKDIVELIFQLAPRKVYNRVAKSLEHFSKAATLQGIDEEMGAIRLIAAEEELVVAIFEWLKLNSKTLPDHNDFIGKFKNHQVKLAFHPVLSQLVFVLSDIFVNGITIEGYEDFIHWKTTAVKYEDKVTLQIMDSEEKIIANFNPLDISITHSIHSDDDISSALYSDFEKSVLAQKGMTVREFVTARANFRNKLLYSEDGAIFSMDQSLKSLTDEVFFYSLRDLLWCLATLITNKPTKRSWGLVSQFIDLYRRVLLEAKIK